MNESNDDANDRDESPSSDPAPSDATESESQSASSRGVDPSDGSGAGEATDEREGDLEDTSAETAAADAGADAEEAAPAGASRTPDEPPAEADVDVDHRSVAEKADLDESVIDQSRKPSTRVRLQWILRTAIASAVLGAVLGGAAYLLADEVAVLPAEVQAAMLVGGATFAVVFVAGTARALLLYRSWEYVVREDSLYLSRGVFTRVRTIVPYVRVQHIDTQRNPVERVLGLSTLVVYTAGSRGADVTIPGLTPERASELQTRLKVLAIESEEEDAV